MSVSEVPSEVRKAMQEKGYTVEFGQSDDRDESLGAKERGSLARTSLSGPLGKLFETVEDGEEFTIEMSVSVDEDGRGFTVDMSEVDGDE